MSYNVLMGTINHTHSFTISSFCVGFVYECVFVFIFTGPVYVRCFVFIAFFFLASSSSPSN